MTELEPAVIGDALLRERVTALDLDAPGGPYAHWLGGSVPETLAGTAYPGDVHLRLDVSPWEPPDLPLLDLAWSAPDVGAMLDEMLERLGLLPEPVPITENPDWPTQELKRIVKEEQ